MHRTASGRCSEKTSRHFVGPASGGFPDRGREALRTGVGRHSGPESGRTPDRRRDAACECPLDVASNRRRIFPDRRRDASPDRRRDASPDLCRDAATVQRRDAAPATCEDYLDNQGYLRLLRSLLNKKVNYFRLVYYNF